MVALVWRDAASLPLPVGEEWGWKREEEGEKGKSGRDYEQSSGRSSI
jgi:hypothetical protein